MENLEFLLPSLGNRFEVGGEFGVRPVWLGHCVRMRVCVHERMRVREEKGASEGEIVGVRQ